MATNAYGQDYDPQMVTCRNPACRATYQNPVQLFGVIGSISNVSSSCPNCGTMNKMQDGTFDFDEKGIATLLAGPDVTPEVLQSLKTLVLEARANPVTAQNFTTEVNNILPSLGDRFEKYLQGRQYTMAFFGLLLALIGTVLTGASMMSSSPAPAASPPLVNSHSMANPLSAKKINELRRLQHMQQAPAKRGSNLTPPKKKTRRKK